MIVLILVGALVAVTLLAPSPGEAAVLTAVIASIGALVVASGWQGMTGLPLSTGEKIGTGLTGLVAIVVTVFSQDLSWAAGVSAVGVLVLVLLTLAEVPAAGASTMPVERLMTLPNSVSALLVVVSGSCWVALEGAGQDRAVLIGLAGLLVAAGAELLPSSIRVRTFVALAVGGLVGGIGGVIGWVLFPGRSSPAVLADMTGMVGSHGAAGLVGVATGVSVAMAVLALGGVVRAGELESSRTVRVGSRRRRGTAVRAIPRIARVARGCAPMLVVSVPVWAIVLVGGA